MIRTKMRHLLRPVSSNWVCLVCTLAYFWTGLAELLDFHPSKKVRSWSKAYRQPGGAVSLALGVF